jgi:putative peptidoglycan lipid II flippase
VASCLRTAVIVALVASLLASVGLVVVPVAFLAGEMTRLAVLIRRSGVSQGFSSHLDRAFGWRVAQQVPPSMLTSAAPTVDRLLVSGLGLGSVALLDLADRTTGFFIMSVVYGVLPVLYRHWARIREPAVLRSRILRTTRVVLISSMGLALLAAAVLPPVIAAVAGISTPSVRASLDSTLWFLLAGFPGYVASQVLVRLMILERLHRWFNVTAVLQLGTNIVLDLLLGFRWGVPGVAAATALVWWLGLGLCYWIVRGTSIPDRPPAPVESNREPRR